MDATRNHLRLVDVGDAINWTDGPEPEPSPAADARVGRGRRLRGLTGWLLGLVALPLSALPFVAYARYDGTGSLIALRAERHLTAPHLTPLPAGERAAYARETLTYEDALVTLVFHSVLDGGGGNGDEGGEGMRMGVRRFGDDLQMLRAAGYRTVTPEQVAAWHAGRGTLPAKALLLTFDDGRVDTVLNAAPLVRAAGMRATLFTIAGAYEKSPVYYASPDQLRGLERQGWSVEAHAVNGHQPVPVGRGRTLPYMSAFRLGADGRLEGVDAFRSRVAREYRDASAAARTVSGAPVTAYAWPFGAYGADTRTNDRRIASIDLEEARRVYALGFNDDGQASYLPATRATDPLRISRLRVEPGWTPRALWRRLQLAVAAGAPEVDHAS